jgi:hypothetical protein
MKLRAVVVILLCALSVNTGAASPATERSIRELLTLTGAGNIGVQVVQNMVQALKRVRPQVPESFWVEFMKDVNSDELVNGVIPIYQKHFTEEDLQAAIKFYRSPAGRRFIEKQPIVVQESMQAGQQWGQQIAKRAMDKAQKLESKAP